MILNQNAVSILDCNVYVELCELRACLWWPTECITGNIRILCTSFVVCFAVFNLAYMCTVSCTKIFCVSLQISPLVMR